MRLQIADWHDYLKVLHETVHIWSAGLSARDYQLFLQQQQSSPWFKQNCRLYTLKDSRDRIQASCKLYSLNLSSRGRNYRVAGLGAVYTQSSFRNQGLASELINDVLDFCEDSSFDGVVLFSEIATEFYEDFGFESLGSGTDFEIEARRQPAQLLEHASTALARQVLSTKQVPLLYRLYNRWLRCQPYGVARDIPYWLYKVQKEEFLSHHAANGRPGLGLGILGLENAENCENNTSAGNGYFIGEETAGCLRILEIIGDRPARQRIWLHLLSQLLTGKIQKLSGWEGLIRDMAPSFQIRGLDLNLGGMTRSKASTQTSLASSSSLMPEECLKVFFRQRTWGQCMIHVLNPQLKDWLQIDPCPLLEFDHL
ncbi:MAG TPA: GNAT family N-acetyltransferase [Oculatellaceae cyanobacterium]